MRFLTFCFALLLLCAVGAGVGSPSVAHAQDEDVDPDTTVTGSWDGTIEVQNTTLRVVFHIDRTEEGELSGSMDSPDQGATGIPLSNVSVEQDSVVLDVGAIKGRFTGKWNEDDQTIEGVWVQGGQSFPLVLSPIKE